MRRLHWPALALAILTACGSGTASRPDPVPTTLQPCRATAIASVGQTIPFDCEFRTLAGGTLKLASLKGTPAVINFWASWCPNCVDEMPALEQTHKELGDRVRILGANLLGVDGETETEAKAFFARFSITYDSIYDEGGLLYAHFSPRLFPPTTIWVDANGVIKHRKFGPMSPASLRADIAEHLGVS